MEILNYIIYYGLLLYALIFLAFFIRPFAIKFYYNYIDKSPIQITLKGKSYIFDRKSKVYLIDQIKDQDELRELLNKESLIQKGHKHE